MESSILKRLIDYISIPIISVIILLLFTIYSSVISPFTMVIFFFLIDFTLFLALVHLFSDDLSHERWKRKFRKLFKRKPLIGIIQEEDCLRIKSRFTPEDWGRFLGNEFKYEYITSLNIKEISDKFVVIINPYGECYPEKDILDKISFKRIKEYVKNGGIFVSISGCPFWFAWNKLSIGAPSTAKEVYSYSGGIDNNGIIRLQHTYSLTPSQSLTETITNYELGVLTTTGNIVLRQVSQSNRPTDNDTNFFGDLVNIGGIDLVFEFRAVRKPVQSCVPILRSNMEEIDDANIEIYPLASILYGQGHFIFTGMHMDIDIDTLLLIQDEEHQEFILGYIPDEQFIMNIINAQAQKVCVGLKNLIENEDEIKRYIKESR